MKVKNLSKNTLFVSWMPAFEPSEVREVSEEDGSLLLRNDNFEEVKEEKKSKGGSLETNVAS